MTAGILRNWYLSRLNKSKTPIEYFFVMQEYMSYEFNIFNFNVKRYLECVFDK